SELQNGTIRLAEQKRLRWMVRVSRLFTTGLDRRPDSKATSARWFARRQTSNRYALQPRIAGLGWLARSSVVRSYIRHQTHRLYSWTTVETHDGHDRLSIAVGGQRERW